MNRIQKCRIHDSDSNRHASVSSESLGMTEPLRRFDQGRKSFTYDEHETVAEAYYNPNIVSYCNRYHQTASEVSINGKTVQYKSKQ